MHLDKRDPLALWAYQDLAVLLESQVLREEEETLVCQDQKVPKGSKEKEDHRELEDLKDLPEKLETTEIRVHQVQLESPEQRA